MSEPEHTDPFAEIVSGLEMYESGLREFETISPDAVLALHGALLARAQPYEIDKEKDPELLAAIVAHLEILVASDFDRINAFRAGDHVKFSRRGLAMTFDEERGGGIEFINRGISISGTVTRPIVCFAPIDPDILISPIPEDDEDGEKAIPMQITTGIVLENAVIIAEDKLTGLVEEDPYADDVFVFVPLLYPGMKVQKEIVRTI